MSNSKMRILVNGYSVIGKRVADAAATQDDMELVGVADVVSDWRIQVAVEKGYPMFATTNQAADGIYAAGILVQSSLHDLHETIDVVADCTPKGIGATNLDHYREHGVKPIFQGGEKHSLTGHSFVAQANYESALGRDATRLDSCNTNSIDEVADATVKCLLRAVPAAVPGIAFLSGGQSSELASARLNAMNVRFKARLPWALAFSFARVIQQPALEIWQGEESHVLAAQQALHHRAMCNRAARHGEYNAAMERTLA